MAASVGREQTYDGLHIGLFLQNLACLEQSVKLA
jgi:hypothetical protein